MARAIAASHRRSAMVYRLDPRRAAPASLACDREVAGRREVCATLVQAAGEALNQLHAAMCGARFAILLSSADGFVLEHRVADVDGAILCRHGCWTGADWSEPRQGTNAIGLALIERRPVVVRGDEHFLEQIRNFTCAGAPIFDASAALAGALAVAHPQGRDGDGAALAQSVVGSVARAIEERSFRARFCHMRTILAQPTDAASPPILLAIDAEQRVVGACRFARAALGLDEAVLSIGIGLAALFPGPANLGQRGWDGDVPALARDRAGRVWRAIVTYPLAPSGAWRGRLATIAHTRPRTIPPTGPSAKARAVTLAPHVLRRVKRYIEDHLAEPLPLADLARLAGLGRSHFSEAFRGSTGMPPHRWILIRRIERAKELLRDLQLPITELALALGFASSSHFSAAFRAVCQVTPSGYRARAGIAQQG